MARAQKIVLVITAVDFDQFSLYSIGTIIVQGALSWLTVSFSLHVKYTGIVSYIVSYRGNSVCPSVRHVPLFYCTLNTQVSCHISYRIVAILSVHPSVTFRCSIKTTNTSTTALPFPKYREILAENRNFFITPVFDAPVTGIPVGILP